MAQYKVPQDVEADDKLLGPFTFRQFIYLIIVAAFIALAWGLFQIFPLLAIAPLPIIVFFGALALPIKKDQPMETYLTAIISFYLKPRKRLWKAGQPESTIEIAAPKITEESRVKNISEDEAAHRLSFLSNLIDTNAQLITGSQTAFHDNIMEDAANTQDMFETAESFKSDTNLDRAEETSRQELVAKMAEMIKAQESPRFDQQPTVQKFNNMPSIQPLSEPQPQAPEPVPVATEPESTPDPALANLAEQKDYSVETIAKEANRISQKRDNEVFISLRGNK